ncbi:MAG: cytochrome c biogenesis protein CcsA [candidate division Zixibacteria bacterium]|nr:cytochrome c biogenesis protein CcsA [candidate division Zixibacteria bacterium]
MWWKLLIFVVMAIVIVASFVTPAPQKVIGEASRVFYYHIPQAWVCVVAFAISMVYSIRYLMKRQLVEDDRAGVAAGLGLIFCILATVTGSVFAKVTWGSFWNWDPRETSIFILLLIYGAYFALRGAIETEERRATLAAVYSIFAFVTVPFLIFVVPRMVPSLHPADSIVDKNMKFTMGPSVRAIFFTSLALFTALFFWMLSLGVRVQRLIRRDLEKEL